MVHHGPGSYRAEHGLPGKRLGAVRGASTGGPHSCLGADLSSQPHESDPATATRRDRGLRADARRNRERALRTAQRLFATEGLTPEAEALAAAEFDLRPAAPAEQ